MPLLAAAAAAYLSVGCAGSSGTGSTGPATTAPATESTAVAAVAPDVPDGPDTVASTTIAVPTSTVEFVAEVWADNWFALYANGVPVGEDSVPITTERSFNADTITFRASYPLTIAMVTKDYKADDSGLEYLGTPRQQLGDGGFIAQVRERASGRLVAATGTSWRGLVVHRAPLDEGCAKDPRPMVTCRWQITPEPAGWSAPGFDDADWTAATRYSTAEVGTKDGYDQIRWDPAASLIWSSDLRRDNTVLWRAPLVVAR
jgi:hypothetical protein